jgi:hypothetical protein
MLIFDKSSSFNEFTSIRFYSLGEKQERKRESQRGSGGKREQKIIIAGRGEKRRRRIV